MKNTVLIATLLLTFASGYLIASNVAASSPVLLEVAAATEVVSCQQNVGLPNADKTKVGEITPHQTNAFTATSVANTNTPESAKRGNPAEMTLNDYSNTIAAQLPAATRLLIRIDDNEFQQLLANHQQQAAGDLAALEYQNELADYLSEQHDLTLLELDCRADLCLLEIDVQDETAWTKIFAGLSSQSWWQSVSYQSAAEGAGSRRLLLQQDSGQNQNQTAMLPDDGASQ